MIIDLHTFVLALTRLPHQFKAELTETLAKGGFVPTGEVILNLGLHLDKLLLKC